MYYEKRFKRSVKFIYICVRQNYISVIQNKITRSS